MVPVEQALVEFSLRSISGEAAMRAMVEAGEWYVPMLYGINYLPPKAKDDVVLVSEQWEAEARLLPLFSGREAAERAEGLPLGPMIGPYAGVEVFGALRTTLCDRVEVNPGPVRQAQFYMESSAFALAWDMVAAVRLEGALDTNAAFAALRDYPHFSALVDPADGGLFPLSLPELQGVWGVLFTTPDRYELYARATGARPPVVHAGGKRMFEELARAGLWGVIINPRSPREVRLPADVFARVAAMQ